MSSNIGPSNVPECRNDTQGDKGTVHVQNQAREQEWQDNALAPKTAEPNTTKSISFSDFVGYVKEITNENGYFDEPMPIDQAEMIRRYADALEKCRITPSIPKLPPATVAELLACKPPDKPFFPHLRFVSIADICDISFYPLLLSPGVEVLEMVRVSEDATLECISFLKALSQTSRNIQTISFSESPLDSARPCPFLEHLPLFQDSLAVLALSFGLPYNLYSQDQGAAGCGVVCPLRLLAVLNQLHKLEKLAISFKGARLCECNLDQPVVARGIQIPNLKSLSLAIAPTYFVRVFGRQQFNVAEELRIGLIPGVDDGEVDFPSVMETFTEAVMAPRLPPTINLLFDDQRLRCPPSLLKAFLTSPTTAQFMTRHRYASIPFNAFTELYYQPGLTFPNLTRILVEYYGDDTPLSLPTLRNLVKMFPNLEELRYLEVEPEIPPNVPVTAEKVSVSCPRLHTLGICEYKKSKGLPPQEDILAIARWLSETFPSLTSKNLDVWTRDEDEGGAWARIKEVMLVMEG